jgi:hypothetical protein
MLKIDIIFSNVACAIDPSVSLFQNKGMYENCFVRFKI